MRFFVLFIVLVLIVGFIVLFTGSAKPTVQIPASVNAIGRSTPVAIHISDPHGVRHVKAFLEQNGTRYSLGEQSQPSHRLFPQRHVADTTFNVTAGTQNVPQLKDGKAQIIVEATSNDFRGSTVSATKDVVVVTR